MWHIFLHFRVVLSLPHSLNNSGELTCFFMTRLDAAEFIASSIRDSYSDESGLMVDKKDSSEVEWASTRDEVYPPDSPPICRVGSRKDREDIFFSTACSLQKVVRTHVGRALYRYVI